MLIDNRYWAGFFDGEGHISVRKTLTQVQIQVTQKEPSVLYLLASRFGGVVEPAGVKKNAHRWRLSSSKASGEFLKEISPYLIIKAVEAKAAIEIINRMTGKRMSAAAREKEMAERQRLRDFLMADRADEKQIA